MSVDEGFIDRQHQHSLRRVVIENVGGAMVITGPHADDLARVSETARSTWVPRILALQAHQLPANEPFDASVACEYLPGVSLLSLLAQSRATRRFLPVQAVAVVVHDAGLAVDAIDRAARQLELRVSGVTPLSVRVGFRGHVQVFPLPDPMPETRDIIGVYPMQNFLGTERGVDLGSSLSPEAVQGLPLPRSEPVFHLGALLVTALRGQVVGGPPADSVFEQLRRIMGGEPPALPDDVPAVLRDLISRSVCRDERRLPDLAQFASVLRQAFDLTDGRIALAAHVQALFPQEVRAQEAFVLEGRHQAPTRPNLELSSPRVRIGTTRFEVDVRLVTHGDFAQFLSQTGHLRPEHFVETPELLDQPLIMVSHADAEAYARWRGGRLPTDLEWTLLSGEARCRDLGRVWEWTSDHEQSGWTVRGGPWRNQSGPGLPDHHSWEKVATPDVGFRCLYDVP